MKKELTVAVLALGMVLSIGSAAAQTQTSDVNVTVSSVTKLDVRPSTLSYGTSSTLEPGDSMTSSASGYEHIEIANIGSTEIADITAAATMPSNQTFGATGLNTGEQFDTGNFVTVSTDTAQQSQYDLADGALVNLSNMHYINRVEYAEQTPPTYIETEDTANQVANNDVSSVQVGRFRVGGAEYFWAFYGDSGTNGDTGVLRIGSSPHTSTVLGTTDLSNSGSDYVTYVGGDNMSEISSSTSQVTSQPLVSFDTSSGTGNYSGQSLLADDGTAASQSTLDEVAGTNVRNYNLYADLASSQDTEDFILRTTVNTKPDDPADTSSDVSGTEVSDGAQTPIFAASIDSNKLQPGQSFPVDIGVQLPLGVAEDRITEGTVTVSASS
jgi:hypothetical protein